jgi:hypothetical protein
MAPPDHKAAEEAPNDRSEALMASTNHHWRGPYIYNLSWGFGI